MACASLLRNASRSLQGRDACWLPHGQARSFSCLKLSLSRRSEQHVDGNGHATANVVTTSDSQQAAVVTRDSSAVDAAAAPSAIEVFHCESIVMASLRMRRRVQLGIALQVAGTQVSNFVFHSDWNAFMHAVNTFHFENSAALLAVSVIAIWKYHAFVRDAFIARHVTRIAVEPSASGKDSNPSCSGASSGQRVLLIETGPWQRRVTFTTKKRAAAASLRDEVAAPGQTIQLGRFLNLGVLHADRRAGEVLNQELFHELLHEDLQVDKEEVITDMACAQQAFVSPDKIMPFLADAGVSESSEESEMSFMVKLEANAWYRQMCQIPGRSIMEFYGYFALVMGVGAIVIWIVPRRKS